jgi:hypothetical protein
MSEIKFHTHTEQDAADKLTLYRAQLRFVDQLLNYFSIMRLNRSVILEQLNSVASFLFDSINVKLYANMQIDCWSLAFA